MPLLTTLTTGKLFSDFVAIYIFSSIFSSIGHVICASVILQWRDFNSKIIMWLFQIVICISVCCLTSRETMRFNRIWNKKQCCHSNVLILTCSQAIFSNWWFSLKGLMLDLLFFLYLTKRITAILTVHWHHLHSIWSQSAHWWMMSSMNGWRGWPKTLRRIWDPDYSGTSNSSPGGPPTMWVSLFRLLLQFRAQF